MTPDGELSLVELKHALEGVAKMLAAYHKELTEQGFTHEDAMRLVLSYQRGLQSGASES